MRVLVTGGGTGGHVNPALAIANTIKENIPDAEIAFVGTIRGLENELVPKAGYKLYHVDVRGIRRSLSLYNIRSLWLAAISPVKAKKIIKEFKPDLVVGTGGYVSWPILVAASRMNIPTAVHESNAVPGLAVRKLVPYVDRIFTNFAVSAEILGKSGKVMQVGCPMLGQFGNISRDEPRDPFLLICGRFVLAVFELYIEPVEAGASYRENDVRNARLYALPLELRRLEFVTAPSVRHVVEEIELRERPELIRRPRKQSLLLCGFPLSRRRSRLCGRFFESELYSTFRAYLRAAFGCERLPANRANFAIHFVENPSFFVFDYLRIGIRPDIV